MMRKRLRKDEEDVMDEEGSSKKSKGKGNIIGYSICF